MRCADDIPPYRMHELRSLLPYLRPYRREPTPPGWRWSSSPTSSHVVGPRSSSRASTPFATRAPVPRSPDAPSASCSLVALLGGVARYGMRELLNSGSRRVETDLRDQLYRHLQRMSAEFYDRYPTGDVMARTTNDLLAVRMVAGPALMYLVDTTIRALLIAPAHAGHQPSAHAARPHSAARLAGGHGVARPADPPAHARPSRRSSAISPPRRTRTCRGVRVVRAYRQERAEIEPVPRAERRIPRAQSGAGPGAGRLLSPPHPARRTERAGGALRRGPPGHGGHGSRSASSSPSACTSRCWSGR